MRKRKAALFLTIVCVLSAVLLTGCDAIQAAVSKVVQSASASPVSSASPAPSIDPKGSIIGQTYTNPSLGFTITYPKEFKLITVDQSQNKLKDLLQAQAQSSNNPAGIPVTWPISAAVLSESDTQVATISVNVSDNKEDSASLIELLKQAQAHQPEGIKFSDPVALKVDGKDAVMIKLAMQIEGIGIYSDIFMFNNGNHTFMINYSYNQDKYAQYGLDAFATIVLS